MTYLTTLEYACAKRLLASASRGAAGDARDAHILASSTSPSVRRLSTMMSEMFAHFDTMKPPKSAANDTQPEGVSGGAQAA